MKGVNPPVSGMTGRRFLAMMSLALFLIFSATILLTSQLRPDLLENLNFVDDFLMIHLLKITTTLGLTGLLAWLYFSPLLGLHRNPAGMVRELSFRMKHYETNAYAIQLGGIFLIAVEIVTQSGGATLTGFLFHVLIRGTIGLLIGLFATTGICWFFGIRSAEQFRKSIQDANDSEAFLLTAVMYGLVRLAMSIG